VLPCRVRETAVASADVAVLAAAAAMAVAVASVRLPVLVQFAADEIVVEAAASPLLRVEKEVAPAMADQLAPVAEGTAPSAGVAAAAAAAAAATVEEADMAGAADVVVVDVAGATLVEPLEERAEPRAENRIERQALPWSSLAEHLDLADALEQPQIARSLATPGLCPSTQPFSSHKCGGGL